MKQLFALCFSALIFSGCFKKSMSLPDQIPSDFLLHYQVDGGMSDYRVDLKLYRDTIELFLRRENEKINKKESLKAGDFPKLYAMLKDSHVETIEFTTIKEPIQNRGGRSLKLSWDKNEIYLSDAHNNFVKENSYENWTMVIDKIERFAGISK